jgi:hypothetical protein
MPETTDFLAVKDGKCSAFIQYCDGIGLTKLLTGL